jgi:hypothetical protein
MILTVRLAVLTSGVPYAERVLLGLGLAGVTPDALLLVDAVPRRGSRARKAKRVLRQPPRRLAAALARRGLGLIEGGSARWEGLAGEVVPAGPLNGPAMLERMRALRPDYLLLAGAGIVAEDALDAVGRGTLNAHPALLPWAPGLGVVERSLERGVPVGVTAHYVDAGIDTGQVIRRELLPVSEADTLRSLRDKAQERCARLLVELAVAAAGGRHPDSFAQRGHGELCAWPDAAGLERLERRVREGLAVRLHREWLDFYGSPVLPMSDERSPEVALAAG